MRNKKAKKCRKMASMMAAEQETTYFRDKKGTVKMSPHCSRYMYQLLKRANPSY